MSNKFQSQPVHNKLSLPRSPLEEEFLVNQAQVNLGMITDTDANDIPDGAFVELRNARVRFDRTSTRIGSRIFTPTKPDSLSVLGVYPFKKNDLTKHTLRFTPTKIYKRTGVWTEITSASPITGAATDRFNVAVAFNSFAFANNGVDYIQVIDPTVATYARLGNAKKYRYLTSFANRYIAANLADVAGPNPVEIAGCADGVITQWDPTVDDTAFVGPLADSPTDFADFITGVQGFANVLVVLRENSIWVGSKQAIRTQPIYFSTAFPGIGCDMPYSKAVIPNGLIWADSKRRRIWAWTVGSNPEIISLGNEERIFRTVSNPELCFCSFNPKELEYELAIVQPGSNRVDVWVYNFRTKAWTYDERQLLTSINDLDTVSTDLTVDQLQGTVDDLVGNVNDLGSTGNIPTRLYGYSDGEIREEGNSLNDEGSGLDNNFVLLSKTYNFPNEEAHFVDIKIEIEIKNPCTINFFCRKNGKISSAYSKSKSYTVQQREVFKVSKNISCKSFQWGLTCTNGLFDFIHYTIRFFPGGEVKGTK